MLKYLSVLLLLLTIPCLGSITSNTLYQSDAIAVSNTLYEQGINVVVSIEEFDGQINYYIAFPGEYWSCSSITGFLEGENLTASALFGYAAKTVALISESTSWHSDYMVLIWEDNAIAMPTIDVRRLTIAYDANDIVTFNNIIQDCALILTMTKGT